MNLFRASKTIWVAVFFFFALMMAFLTLSCGSGGRGARSANNANSNSDTSAEVITISTAKAETRELPAYIQVTGNLIADETSDVSPLVAGKLVSTPVNIGDFVRQGTVIAKLDDRDARLRVKEAEVNLRQAQVAVRQAEAKLGLDSNGNFIANDIPEVRAANANYEQALAEQKLAESNEKRYRELVETGDVASILYDQFRTTRDTARAKTNSAKQALEAAKNTARQGNEGVKNAQVMVDAARTQLEMAQKSVTDMVIKSPYAGYISARNVALGEFVSTSTPLITLVRTNPLKAQLSVSEADVPSVRPGLGISLEVKAWQDRKFAGTVSAVNPSVDQNTRTAIVEGEVENGDNALRSGMFATARILRPGGEKGVFVPKSAVYSDINTQSYRVFTVDGDVVRLKVVQLGLQENDTWQIVSGLQGDETLAVSNLEQLYEGARINVVQGS
ncbi:MAG TPA: efflux RND transporter periplasmic adaptor subunit [Pyrinomonadaceae bacterium]|jgi:multidrug efflux pump subunit AcrA (membrane-fusion protein)|nr:efflux RND transporter periplasmic adaptor subunit [Pyrinomonadaceae bacterium]